MKNKEMTPIEPVQDLICMFFSGHHSFQLHLQDIF